MNRFDIPLVARGLTAYAIERQNGRECHQRSGAPTWQEQRRFWSDAILQGMARLEGLIPDPTLMERFDRRLEAARECGGAEVLPPKEQGMLIRELRQYVAVLEATGDDRRRQVNVVRELLEDMSLHPHWRDGDGSALDHACENICVLRVEPNEAPEMIVIPNTLESLQAEVGGCIEALGLDCGVCLICNEEGKLMGLPANRRVGGDTIAGTFLVVGEADGEFCSLSDADAVRCAEEFAQPLPSSSGPDKPTQWELYVL